MSIDRTFHGSRETIEPGNSRSLAGDVFEEHAKFEPAVLKQFLVGKIIVRECSRPAAMPLL